MKLPAMLTLAALLGGCATFIATVTGDDGGWLIGTWCPDQRTTAHGGAEVALRPTRFYANGDYATFAETGRWRFRDRALRLTRRSTPPAVRTDRVRLLPTGAMVWTMAQGRPETWHRCHATP